MTNFQKNLIQARNTARDILAGVATEKEKRDLFNFLDGCVTLDSKPWIREVKLTAEQTNCDKFTVEVQAD